MGQSFPSFIMFVCFSTFVVTKSFITVEQATVHPRVVSSQ